MSADRVYHGTPCKRCGMTERYRSSRGCVHCRSYYNKVWAKKNPEAQARIRRKYHLLRKYGLTLLEYREMLARQSGGCAICGTNECVTRKPFCVDHCHKTEQVRGLLCKSCNIGLGELKDDPALLRRAAKYLEESIADV